MIQLTWGTGQKWARHHVTKCRYPSVVKFICFGRFGVFQSPYKTSRLFLGKLWNGRDGLCRSIFHFRFYGLFWKHYLDSILICQKKSIKCFQNKGSSQSARFISSGFSIITSVLPLPLLPPFPPPLPLALPFPIPLPLPHPFPLPILPPPLPSLPLFLLPLLPPAS